MVDVRERWRRAARSLRQGILGAREFLEVVRTSRRMQRRRPWRPGGGKISVVHTAECHSVRVGGEIRFTVTVTNRSRMPLVEVRLVQRSFTDACVRPLTHATPMLGLFDPRVPVLPGGAVQFEGTYWFDAAAFSCPGEIISAVAVHALDVAGGRFYGEQDAVFRVPDRADVVGR